MFKQTRPSTLQGDISGQPQELDSETPWPQNGSMTLIHASVQVSPWVVAGPTKAIKVTVLIDTNRLANLLTLTPPAEDYITARTGGNCFLGLEV